MSYRRPIVKPAASPSSSASAQQADPATQGPAPLPAGTDIEKARERAETAVDNVRADYDAAPSKAAPLSGRPDGDTQGGPGANNDAAQPPANPTSGKSRGDAR